MSGDDIRPEVMALITEYLTGAFDTGELIARADAIGATDDELDRAENAAAGKPNTRERKQVRFFKRGDPAIKKMDEALDELIRDGVLKEENGVVTYGPNYTEWLRKQREGNTDEE